MTRVKVCGHTRPEDVDATVAAGADAVGVVVDVPVDTPREVSVERAAALFDRVPPLVSGVLVTMATDPERVRALYEATGADAVQLHATLPASDVAAVAEFAPTLAVADADAPGTVRGHADVADAVLVDSTDAAGGGGTGRTHDWEATRSLAADLDAPVVLAGGLTPENVGDAVETVAPFGVDVATGVEREGGVKDHDAVRAFVAGVETATPGEVVA
ncbi:MAG: phosphoribosylanthranilate isomerase [Halobacteriaceae archaeon]